MNNQNNISLNSSMLIGNNNMGINQYNLNRDYSIDFTFTIPPDTYKWFVIE